MPLLKNRYRIERIERGHDRKSFSCGQPRLDRYFQKQARQDMVRNVAAVFVAIEAESDRVCGFYTLAACGVGYEKLPAHVKKKLPPYGDIPAIRLGRLAVQIEFQEKGLGQYLLMDAMRRSHFQEDIAWAVFLVDAKDDRAREFYIHALDFQPFADNQLTLFLPRGDIALLFQ